MDSMEFNKIFAAILVAGIMASLAGFISDKAIHPHALETDAIQVEGMADAGAGGGTKTAMPEPVLAMIGPADVARGQTLSKACAACHTFDKGGAVLTGPNLWNVVGKDKASYDGFVYSQAMTDSEGGWSYASLNKFLWKPKAYVQGTKMNYIGLKKPEDRAALIAWLRTLSDSPKALPSDAEIAAEAAELAPPEEAAQESAEKAAAAEPAAAH